MHLKSLELKDFKSFQGTHHFEFPTHPGLYCLTGSNKLEPELGANGTGKSTFFDSIYWCLYGKTLRGLRASDTRFWGSEGDSSVSIRTEVHGTEYNISRVWNPNSLKISGKQVKQEDVDKLIGLNAEAFKHSIIMGQFNPMFFDLPSISKLSLVSEVLGLDKWTDLSERCRKKSSELSKEKIKESERLAGVNGRVEELYTALSRSMELAEQYTSDRSNRLEAFDIEIERLDRKLFHAKQTLEEFMDQKAETEGLLASIGQEVEECDVQHNVYQRKLVGFHNSLYELKIKIENAVFQVGIFDSLEADVKCYICEQNVESTH